MTDVQSLKRHSELRRAAGPFRNIWAKYKEALEKPALSFEEKLERRKQQLKLHDELRRAAALEAKSKERKKGNDAERGNARGNNMQAAGERDSKEKTVIHGDKGKKRGMQQRTKPQRRMQRKTKRLTNSAPSWKRTI